MRNFAVNKISRRAVIRAGASAGLLGAVNAAYSPAIAQTRTIKVGYISPQSGALALFGEADAFILDAIRGALKGGVSVGGKSYPVEILTRDTQSNPNRAAEVANDLISGAKVDLVVVASAPETVNPVSDQCELNGVPCISSICPWQPWIFGRGSAPDKGFASTFHFFWGLEDITTVFANMWDMIPTNKSVGREKKMVARNLPSRSRFVAVMIPNRFRFPSPSQRRLRIRELKASETHARIVKISGRMRKGLRLVTAGKMDG